MDIKYFRTASNDISASEGWFKTILLLGLISFIPIFGIIVVMGYAFGWAREIAWGTRAPLPKKIFGNEDGMYSRGFFALLIPFIYSLIPLIIIGIGSSMFGVDISSTSSRTSVQLGPGAAVGGILYIVGIVAAIFMTMLAYIGVMRMSIYGKFGPGMQIGTVWKMFRQDSKGPVKILLMELVVSLIFGFIFGIILSLALVFMVFSTGGLTLANTVNPSDQEIMAFAVAFLAQFGVFSLVLGYIAQVFTAWVTLLVARAYGYWTSQFNVPGWLGSSDPLPFEAEYPAAYAAAYAAAQAANWQQQQQYSQPYAQQQAYGQQSYYATQAEAQRAYGAQQQQSPVAQGGYPYQQPTGYPETAAAPTDYPIPVSEPIAQTSAPQPQPEPETLDFMSSPLLGDAPAEEEAMTPAQLLGIEPAEPKPEPEPVVAPEPEVTFAPEPEPEIAPEPEPEPVVAPEPEPEIAPEPELAPAPEPETAAPVDDDPDSDTGEIPVIKLDGDDPVQP